MGWQDRDYAREAQYGGRVPIGYARAGGRPRSVAIVLIWVNVAIYILCSLTAGPGRSVLHSPLFQFGAMTSDQVLGGQVWRLVTSDYLHWSTTHIFMNMLGLYFLGPPLERVWGPRKFFAVYAIAGVLGSLFYMILTRVGWLAPGIAAGASGCVLGLLGAAAVLFPQAKVYIYFLFPVKIRVVAIVFALMYTLNIWRGGDNAGGDACHLAGLAFGVWFAMKGDRWWTLKGHRWWAGMFSRPKGTPGSAKRFRAPTRRSPIDEETIDRILAKVRSSGIASLTERERRTLAEATQHQQDEDGPLQRSGGG